MTYEPLVRPRRMEEGPSSSSIERAVSRSVVRARTSPSQLRQHSGSSHFAPSCCAQFCAASLRATPRCPAADSGARAQTRREPRKTAALLAVLAATARATTAPPRYTSSGSHLLELPGGRPVMPRGPGGETLPPPSEKHTPTTAPTLWGWGGSHPDNGRWGSFGAALETPVAPGPSSADNSGGGGLPTGATQVEDEAKFPGRVHAPWWWEQRPWWLRELPWWLAKPHTKQLGAFDTGQPVGVLGGVGSSAADDEKGRRVEAELKAQGNGDVSTTVGEERRGGVGGLRDAMNKMSAALAKAAPPPIPVPKIAKPVFPALPTLVRKPKPIVPGNTVPPPAIAGVD